MAEREWDKCRRFTSQEHAITVAEIMERMTGDKCIVRSMARAYHLVLRDTGDGKMVVA